MWEMKASVRHEKCSLSPQNHRGCKERAAETDESELLLCAFGHFYGTTQQRLDH